jgi:RNA polymerase sigma-70 factor, ECF subfamily
VSGRYGSLSDEDLMRLCSEGDDQALDNLFRRFQHPIYNYCLRFLRDPSRADDVLQETFLRLYNNRTKWKPMARFSSWIYRIARNLCVDETRRYWNRQVYPESQLSFADENGDAFIDGLASSDTGPREALNQQGLEKAIAEAMDELSAEQREVMILHKYQSMTYAEIAEILEISAESVKQRAYRAHLRLRELLEPLLQENQH